MLNERHNADDMSDMNNINDISDISNMSDMNLATLRGHALRRSEEWGLPRRQMERWHYTDLQKLWSPAKPPIKLSEKSPEKFLEKLSENLSEIFSKKLFERNFARNNAGIDSDATGQTAQTIMPEDFYSALAPARLVFINGRLQNVPPECDGVSMRLTRASENEAAVDLTTLANLAQDGLLAANLAYCEDIIQLDIFGHAPRPLAIEWHSTMADSTHYGRLVVKLHENSQLTLLETQSGCGQAHIVNDIDLAQNAALTYVKLHNGDDTQNGIVQTRMRLAAEAKLKQFCFIVNAKMARHETELVYEGKGEGAGAQAELASAVLAGDAQHFDITICADHQQPHSESEMLARSLLCGHRARAVFQGKVRIGEGAQKVNAHQHTAGLLLSEGAEMDTKPELEIYADDVACAHGATIGELDEEALFFLRSRGLDEATAKRLLIDGFLQEVLDRLPDEALRECIAGQMAGKLAQMAQMAQAAPIPAPIKEAGGEHA